MSRLCRLGVRSAHGKSLLLLGLISDRFAQRTHASAKLAEGEELGSNLLQVSLRSPARNYANGIRLSDQTHLRPYVRSTMTSVEPPQARVRLARDGHNHEVRFSLSSGRSSAMLYVS